MSYALLPVAKLLWLAFDLTLRPVGPAELEWHRAADSEFETERDAPPTTTRGGGGAAGRR